MRMLIPTAIAGCLIVAAGALVTESVLSHHRDPRADFPTVTNHAIHLRPKADGEAMRDIVLGPDHMTPLSGRVDLTNGGYRRLFFAAGKLSSTLEYYPPQPHHKPQLAWNRTFMPDGRRTKDEWEYLPNGSLTMEAHRLANATFDKREYGVNKLLKRHTRLSLTGDQMLEELFYDTGVLQKRTVVNQNDLSVDVYTYNEQAQLCEHDYKDQTSTKESRTVYFPASGKVHILAEKNSEQSTATVSREDGTEEAYWVRSEQTMQVTHFDGKGVPLYRQNLLLYRMRVGAEPKMSDYRVFSLDLLGPKGETKAELVFANQDSTTPIVVLVPAGTDVQTNPFVGTEKKYRPDGTLADVVKHGAGKPDVTVEHHQASEGLRYKFNHSYLAIPPENLAIKPTPPVEQYYDFD